MLTAQDQASQDPRVLIVAEELDQTADLIVEELHLRGVPLLRFDVADFPQRLRLVAEHGDGPGDGTSGSWRGLLADGRRTARLERVGAVHWRRPGAPTVADRLTAPYDRWAREQALGGLLGVLYALPATWVNRPEVDGIASHKPGQLPTAAACGLSVPRSIITNDVVAAQRFAASVDGPLICKPVMGGQLQHADGRRHGVPTHVIEPGDLDESIGLTAHFVQEWIPKRHEVRLVVVGTRLFAASIHAASSAAQVDWRTDYDALSYGVVDVPDSVRTGVMAWMKRFGLSFGAFDFAVTPEGEWVMFECNPAGQWAWVQDRTGLPICAAIVDLLIEGLT